MKFPIPNDVEASEELQPRADRAACWDSIDSALNNYLGKNKWDCVDGEYVSAGMPAHAGNTSRSQTAFFRNTSA